MTPTMPTLTPAAVSKVDACTFGQATRLPVASSIKFAARNGNGARAAAALIAPRGSPPGGSRAPGRVRGAEVELVVADRGRGVAERRVRVDDDRAFAQVRFDAALIRVARVDEKHGAAIVRARRAQVAHVTAELGQTAAAVARHEVTVQVGGRDDRQRDDVLRRRSRGRAADADPNRKSRERLRMHGADCSASNVTQTRARQARKAAAGPSSVTQWARPARRRAL